MRKLIWPHGGVRSQGRKDCPQPVAVILPRIRSQLAGTRVLTALVGWYGQHILPLSQLGQGFSQKILQLLRR